MAKNPPEGMPRVTPYLFYDDLKGALDWLGGAFGLTTRMSIPGPEGKLMHAEMTMADGVVMMGQTGMEPTCVSPRSQNGANTQSLYIYVDDVDAHCQRARAAGATIVREPEDQFWGDRMYTARDFEGHSWSFAQAVREVSPEEIQQAIEKQQAG
ncbi:MAG: VOC family protein [Geminicoccaceae bacterium]|nr:VOC family protein [Geminicoccaceae bacterium]